MNNSKNDWNLSNYFFLLAIETKNNESIHKIVTYKIIYIFTENDEYLPLLWTKDVDDDDFLVHSKFLK